MLNENVCFAWFFRLVDLITKQFRYMLYAKNGWSFYPTSKPLAASAFSLAAS
jgi:hypothetical protein